MFDCVNGPLRSTRGHELYVYVCGIYDLQLGGVFCFFLFCLFCSWVWIRLTHCKSLLFLQLFCFCAELIWGKKKNPLHQPIPSSFFFSVDNINISLSLFLCSSLFLSFFLSLALPPFVFFFSFGSPFLHSSASPLGGALRVHQLKITLDKNFDGLQTHFWGLLFVGK